jgi:amino acid adenylation domain-containing protein
MIDRRTPLAQQLFDVPEDWHGRTLYISADCELTFSDVRRRMLAIAGWLRAVHDIRPGHRVAICLPKNFGTICLIYGVLAAGACIVPLQFNGPADRLNAQLDRLRPHLLVTVPSMRHRLENHSGGALPAPIVCIENTDDVVALDRLVRGADPLASPIAADPDSPAAIYFTSGSTGEPKGIMLSPRGMAGAVAALSAGDTIHSDDRMIGHIALHYASSLHIFYPLLGGACVRLVSDEDAMFPDLVAGVLLRDRITLWTSTVTALRLLVEHASQAGTIFDALRFVRFFGEHMPVSTLRTALDLMPNATFQNVYGASEAFSMMTYRVPRPVPAAMDSLPLGQPTDVHRFILCDANGNPVRDGEIGEICVSSDTVMTGYWDEPALTRARRLPGIENSFRTGDFARLDTDGNYRFAGRVDHQIKIRGHRFDLGEIETVLRSHPKVRDAVAFVSGTGPSKGRVLAAVLASRNDASVTELAAHCAARLPSFARPAGIVFYDRFPQLASGKVDRVKLGLLTSPPTGDVAGTG